MDEYLQNIEAYEPPSRLESAANGFRKWGHRVSLLPILGGFFAAPMTLIATALDTTDKLINKSIGSGVKAAISGTADTFVTGTVSLTNSALAFGAPVAALWWMPANWATALATENTLGEWARKGTKSALDSVIGDGPIISRETQQAREARILGNDPATAGYAPAAMAYAPYAQQQMMPQAPLNPATSEQLPPNYWSDKEAQRRGQSPEEARRNFVRNNYEEAVALQRAAAQPAELGVS